MPAILALLITLSAGLAAQAGPASAASAASAATAAATPARPAAGKPAAASPVSKPAAVPRAAAISPTGRRAAVAAAARQAITAASVPDKCSGPISADIIYPCSTPSSGGTDTFTLTLTSTTDVLLVQVLSTGGNALPVTITAPDSTAVTCQQPIQLYQCATNQKGTYTLAVSNEGSPYTLDYTALLSESACGPVNPSFAAPVISGSLAAGETGACYSLPMSGGDVLHANTTSTTDPLTVAVFDSAGAQVCADDNGDCTLTGTGPYRVFVSAQYGNADSYDMFLNDITDPAGCVVAGQLTYGQVPAATSSSGMCRTLTVTKADNYRIYSVGPGNPVLQGTVYTASGTSACTIPTGISPYCQLTPGDYSFVADESANAPLIQFGLSFVAADESRGCTAASDTGFMSGPATGRFTGIGEELCLNLPTPSGGTDYFFDQPAADGTVATVVGVVDGTGAPQCSSSNGDFTYAICTLSGTAPFRVILSAGTPKADYQLLVNRSNSTAGCAAWPRSGFGGSWGATVKLSYAGDVKCLVIPAGQHSTGEMIDYSNAANVVDGAINVLDPSGKQVCLGNSTAICSYKSGVTYTALVSTTAAHGDTYHLVRRDVSSTATCARPASTAVGGPSTTFTLTSALDALCWRVTAATAGKLFFNLRTLAPAPAGAVLDVTNAAGAALCGQPYCRVTGNADYQVIVIALGYSGVAITAHLDTWLVGTASGWAPQCRAHRFSASSGWGPVSGTLTEKAAGYCAVVNDLRPLQSFNIFGTDTASYPEAADVDIYTPADWTTTYINGLCGGSNYGEFGFSCSTNQETQPIGQGVLLVTPGNSPNPTGYTMQGVCYSPCTTPGQTPTITAVTPSKQPAGPNHTIVVTGTSLNLGTSFELASNGSPATSYQIAFPQSVNPAGTKLTLLLNTTGVTPGGYDVVLDQVGYTTGTPSPGYLPGGYTVTAAPGVPSPNRFVPVTPERILDTQHGIGARRARVARGGTVNLTVAGKAGVPARGVAAVAVELTAVSPAAAGYLVAYPYRTARPGVTDLSFAAHRTATNLAVVPVRSGKISLHNASSGAVDLTADVVGYYAAGSKGYALTAIGPARILDTRRGTGARKARVAAAGTVVLQVAGKGGVPARGVAAVALDVTAVRPAAAGHLVVYPAGTARPGVTDLSFAARQTVTSLVLVPVRNGKVSLFNASSGKVDLTADVTGYYSASGPLFAALGPVRILDTRSGLGGAGGTILPHAAAVTPPIVNLPPGIPGTVTSVVLDVTVTGAQHSGALTVWPDGGSLPAVQNLVFSAGQTVSGLVIVVPVVDGAIDFYNDSPGSVQVIADLEGYYAT